jgi:hypothetical protein
MSDETYNPNSTDNTSLIAAEVTKEALPCHQCGCGRYIDFEPKDGLCDNLDYSNPANYCKHPLVSHY